MKIIMFALATLIALTGCSTIERAGDWVNGNPLVADMATRQAVARYIDASGDPQGRAQDVMARLQRAQNDLQGDPVVGVQGIMAVLESHVDWDQLSPGDKLLVQDIMLMVQIQLAEKQADEKLSQDTVLAVRSLLRTAISAASLFL